MRRIIVVIIPVCIILITGNLAYRMVVSSVEIQRNKENFSNSVISAPKDRLVNLSEITPFEWDVVYFFDPYTSKKQIYETIGFHWNGVQQQGSEGMMQILFINKGKVVCYCSGSGETNGYFVDGNSLRLEKSEEPQFIYNSELSDRLGYIYIEIN